MKPVIFTGSVPQCPTCQKPTQRTGSGFETVTSMYFQPVYDEAGNNTNPDRNTRTSTWACLGCGCAYTISGNDVDGFEYH